MLAWDLRDADTIRRAAGIDRFPMLRIIGKGGANRINRQVVVCRRLLDIAMRRFESPDDCPDGDTVVLNLCLIEARAAWIQLNVPLDERVRSFPHFWH